ncbi:hypothetical protein STEG23_030550, partial [Scotinomys teguina]
WKKSKNQEVKEVSGNYITLGLIKAITTQMSFGGRANPSLVDEAEALPTLYLTCSEEGFQEDLSNSTSNWSPIQAIEYPLPEDKSRCY